MKERKYELFDTALYDYQYIQQHLTDMAAKGWRLDKVSTIGYWRYRRCEPAKVRYEVTYAPSASAYASHPSVQEEALADLCAEAGWVKVASLAQLHIYCNEAPDVTPLETDDVARIRNIRRAMRKSYLPGQLLLIALFALMLTMNLNLMSHDYSRYLAMPMNVLSVCTSSICIMLFSIDVIGYFLWIRRAERAAKDGLPCPSSSFYRKFRFVLWGFVVFMLVSVVWVDNPGALIQILVYSTISIVVTRSVMEQCKRRGSPKWVNIAVPIACTTVLLLVLMPVTNSFAADLFPEQEEAVTAMPLDVSDLTGSGSGEWESVALAHTASPIAAYGRYYCALPETEQHISYTVVDVQLDYFYDLCLHEQEQEFLQYANRVPDPDSGLNQAALWDADYARHAGTDSSDRWLICWDGRIVSLQASWPLTDAQIEAAAKKLKP